MRTARHAALLGSAWLALFAVDPAVACAQASADAAGEGREHAQALFKEARALLEAGAVAAACRTFQQSLALHDGLGTRFNMADCFERWGTTATAHRLYLEVADATRKLGDPERAAVAQGRANALEPRLTRLLVDLPGMTSDVGVTCDGEPIPRELLGKPVPIDPGEHQVEVRVADAVVWTVKLGVSAEAQNLSITVPAHVLERPKDAPAPPKEPPARAAEEQPTATLDDEPSEAGTSRHTAALALGALGVVGLVGGSAMGLQYLASRDDAKQVCKGTPTCTEGDVARHRELAADARTGRNWAIVGLGVGGAALIGAGALHLTLPRAAPSEAAALTLEPVLSPGAFVGGSVRGRF
jgi:hypothetical protein